MSESAGGNLKMLSLRVLALLAAFLLVALYVCSIAVRHSNYIVADPLSPSMGWHLHGVQITGQRFVAPDGTQAALKVVSTAKNGHLIANTHSLPHGEVTFSVYLRSDRRTLLKIQAVGGDNPVTIVRATPDWQRFSVTIKEFRGGEIFATVGGAESFTEGKLVYLWGAQVEPGQFPSQYQLPIDGTNSSPLHARLRELGFQISAFPGRLLLIFWAIFLFWVGSSASFRTKLAAQVRSSSHCLLDAFRINRFGSRGITSRILVLLITLTTMELFSFIANSFIAGRSVGWIQGSRLVWKQAVLNLDGDQQSDRQQGARSTIFSPTTQIQRIPGFEAPPYKINRLGMIDNEGPDKRLDVMPEKPPGLVRIILYGGSTAMGIGARDGSETITGQLERLLNAHAKIGSMFQVLNFGHGAGITYTDLLFMVSMGVYLSPDASISLNGWNDAFFWGTASSKVYEKHPPLINWSDFSYYYSDQFNGFASPREVTIPIMPFTSALLNRVLASHFARDKSAKEFYERLPIYQVSKMIEHQSPSRDVALLENLRYMASYFIGRDQVFLSYLQPHPLQYRKLLTVSKDGGASEIENVNTWTKRLARDPETQYPGRMRAAFDSFGNRYQQLKAEFRRFSNIRFYDIRGLFQSFPQPAYNDIIHYTPEAQGRLAERIFIDLRKFPNLKKHLTD